MADSQKLSHAGAHGHLCPYCRSELEVRMIGHARLLGTSEFKKSERIYLCPICDVAEERGREPKGTGAKTSNSLQCQLCEVHWPMHDLFFECPTCREPTVPSYAQPDLTIAAALIERNTAEFGWWLWEHNFPTEEEVKQLRGEPGSDAKG